MTTTKERQDTELITERDCSRCDGSQLLLVHHDGFGKYRCDTCGVVVGFDLGVSEHREFLLDRGNPAKYTKDAWGPLLGVAEIRL